MVGLDNGGTKTNGRCSTIAGGFLVDRMLEVPSRVPEGPAAAITAMVEAMDVALAARTSRERVVAVGLDTPGPASADGVISPAGARTSHSRLARLRHSGGARGPLGLPVVYNNDGNAAALYAHHVHFGAGAGTASSVSAIVGTGLGGGVIETGHVVRGASGQAGELGHVRIAAGRPPGRWSADAELRLRNRGDVESVASLTGIERNLLPYWLTRFPEHPLAALPIGGCGEAVRGYGEHGDEMARTMFEQQAMALGRLFTMAANFTDPHAYFVGGGVVEAEPALPRLVPRRCASDTRCARSRPPSPSSRSSPTSTWPVPRLRIRRARQFVAPRPVSRPGLRCADDRHHPAQRPRSGRPRSGGPASATSRSSPAPRPHRHRRADRDPAPFTPVPISLQTFTVLLAGAALGPMAGSPR